MSESQQGNGNLAPPDRAALGRVQEGPQPEAFARVVQEPPPPPKRPFFARPIVWLVLLVIVVGAAIGIRMWWVDVRPYESTDDAFIQADATRVSPRVSGHILAILVKDNQFVEAGASIAELDPRDLQAKLNESQAALLAEQAGLDQAKENAASMLAGIGQAKAAEDAARTEADRARNELHRFEQLSSEAVTQQQLNNYRAAANSADANLAAAAQKTIWAQANAKAANAQIEVAQAQIQQSQAALDAAKLQLSYTTINAPIAGFVTSKSIQPGDYVQVGQAMLELVPKDLYVIANFKETQLDEMKSGQDADVTIDAYPGRTFRGKVASIQRGSGAAFSLLPPENATGNYVKVVQRVPVKIVLQVPDDVVVGPGMSAVPKVRVR